MHLDDERRRTWRRSCRVQPVLETVATDSNRHQLNAAALRSGTVLAAGLDVAEPVTGMIFRLRGRQRPESLTDLFRVFTAPGAERLAYFGISFLISSPNNAPKKINY
jgi:hypothetical protein